MLPGAPPEETPAELGSAQPELHALELLKWRSESSPSPTEVAPSEEPGTPPAETPEATGHKAPPPRTPPRPPAEPTEAPGSPPARPPRWWGPPAGPRAPARRNRDFLRRVRLHNLERRMTIMQQKIDEVLLEQKLIRLQRLHINHMLAKLQQQIQPPTRPIGARRRPAVSERTARVRPSQTTISVALPLRQAAASDMTLSKYLPRPTDLVSTSVGQRKLASCSNASGTTHKKRRADLD